MFKINISLTSSAILDDFFLPTFWKRFCVRSVHETWKFGTDLKAQNYVNKNASRLDRYKFPKFMTDHLQTNMHGSASFSSHVLWHLKPCLIWCSWDHAHVQKCRSPGASGFPYANSCKLSMLSSSWKNDIPGMINLNILLSNRDLDLHKESERSVRTGYWLERLSSANSSVRSEAVRVLISSMFKPHLGSQAMC